MTFGGTWPPGKSFAEAAFATTASAYARSPKRWEHAVQAAIESLFMFLAQHPEQTASCIGGDRAGARSLRERDRLIDRFTQMLDPGFERTPASPPLVVAEAIGGGLYEMVRGHVLEQRVCELPLAIPDATVLALSPFVGPSQALELADSKNVQAEC